MNNGWVFVGVQVQTGIRYLGFRKIEGPGSIFGPLDEWLGDVYMEEDAYLKEMMTDDAQDRCRPWLR